MKRNNLACSHNHCCNEQITMKFDCVVKLNATVTYTKLKFCESMLVWKIYVYSNNKMYMDLNVKCLMIIIII
jgi:hypothetical protein